MRALVAAVVLAVICALVAARGAYGFLPALNDPAPALAHTPPVVVPAPLPALAHRVVLVVVDGLRLDASRGLPVLDAVRARGADATARATFPTISKANYVTIVAGVEPRFSGARTNDSFREVAIDSLFDRAQAAGLPAGYAADRTRGIARLFGVADIELGPGAPAPGAPGLDAAFARSLARNRLVVLLLMEVDDAGHRHGGASGAYLAAARRADAWLGRLFAQLDPARDALIVLADHGHTRRGGHGGVGPDVEDVPLILAGAGIRAGARAEGVSLVDVAPTAAALLGIPAPGHAAGRARTDLLAVTPDQRAALAAADDRRLAALAPVRAAIAAADDDRARTARLVRTPIAALVLALPAALAWRARRRLHLDRRTLAAAGVFVAVFAAAILGYDRWRAVFGVPGDRASMFGDHLRHAGLAALAQLIAWGLVLRRPRGATGALHDRAAGALIATTLVAVAPALAAWALLGAPVATTLPGPVLAILAPIAYTAVAFQAVPVVLAAAAVAAVSARAPARTPA